jgi:hypothetical protein
VSGIRHHDRVSPHQVTIGVLACKACRDDARSLSRLRRGDLSLGRDPEEMLTRPPSPPDDVPPFYLLDRAMADPELGLYPTVVPWPGLPPQLLVEDWPVLAQLAAARISGEWARTAGSSRAADETRAG